MMQPPQQVLPEQVGRVAQIITIALTMGPLMFAGVALMVRARQPPQDTPLEIIGLGMGAIALALRAVLPRLFTAAALRKIVTVDPADFRVQMAPVFLMRCILVSAVLEGAAFFNLVAYMIGGHWSNLGMAGAMVVVIAAAFPTQQQFELWTEQSWRERS